MGSNDGGPAFPVPAGSNGAEHPADRVWNYAVGGMSLRDWFAGQALAGLCAGMNEGAVRDVADGLRGGRFQVEAAYRFADAMLKARETQS